MPLIEDRQVAAEMAEVAAVRVPEAVGHRDAAHARFDQPAGHQQLIVPQRRAVALMPRRAVAVAFAHAGALPCSDRARRRAGCDVSTSNAWRYEMSMRSIGCVVEVAAQIVHRSQQLAAILELICD